MTAQSTRIRTVLGLFTALALVAWIAPATVAGEETGACSVSLEPGTVASGSEPVDVMAKPSKPIGTLVSAQIDDESAVAVDVVDEERSPDGAYALALDLQEAEAGSWTLTLRGLHGQCTGTLHVEGRASAR